MLRHNALVVFTEQSRVGVSLRELAVAKTEKNGDLNIFNSECRRRADRNVISNGRNRAHIRVREHYFNSGGQFLRVGGSVLKHGADIRQYRHDVIVNAYSLARAPYVSRGELKLGKSAKRLGNSELL